MNLEKQLTLLARTALLASLCSVCPVGIRADDATDRVKTIHVPGNPRVVKAQIGADRTIHLLLDTENGPCYVKSSDAGASFSPPIAIVDAAAQKSGLKFQGEDLAVGKKGRVHVAMANNAWKLKLPEAEWGFYYSSLAPEAKSFSAVRNINRKPSEGFSLAADEVGNVTACFLSDKLFTMVSHDDGETFTQYAEPNADWNPCNCCTTAAAFGADGRLAVLYREETDNERDIYLALLGKGKAVRSRVSTTPWKLNGCPMTYFAINRTARGYVAAWPTKGQVYFARLDTWGALLPPGEIKTPGTNGMRNGLLALSARDGATLVGWKDKDVLGWQLYDGEAQPIGKPGSAPSSGGGAAAVVLENGNFLIFP
ncbi:MAG TPA: hypothetical protein VFZ59_00625 [Verrucomicrobiae bacterium]|nr:hypothetical protein [Verrucomicrobiae bacterium]